MAKNKLPVVKAGGSPGSVKEATDGAVYKPSPSEAARERKYKAEDALRDIERAETHKRDSMLMKDVKKLASEKMTALKKIC